VSDLLQDSDEVHFFCLGNGKDSCHPLWWNCSHWCWSIKYAPFPILFILLIIVCLQCLLFSLCV